MSKLQQLIARLCPDGVPYKPLGEVCVIINAPIKLNKKHYQQSGKYPIIDQGQSEIIGFTDNEDALLPSNKYILFGDHTRIIKYFEGRFAQGADGLKILVPQKGVMPRFLFYAMQCLTIENRGYNRHWTVLCPLNIPVPPLEVQAEIVKILDRFAEYTAELQAELQARKEQYEYYRNLLLTFNPSACGCGTDDEQENKLMPWGGWKLGVSWRTMGEIATFKYGFTDKALETGDARYIRITDINESGRLVPTDAKYINLNSESETYLLRKGDLVMARTGATYGKTLFFEDDMPAVYASFLIKIQLDNSIISNRFYWHYSKSKTYWKQADKLVSTGGQPQFNTGAISQLSVPIPSLDVQERIVSILDRFEVLVNDLTEGLPAEIAAVKERYEYYRNRLLTFKQLA